MEACLDMGLKECIRLEVKDRIASIILDSPPDNRMNRNFFSTLDGIITKIEGMEIGALLIYSSGRHFSAGADLEDIKSRIIEPYSSGESLEKAIEESVVKDCKLLSRIEALPIPVIGALSGLCVGSGLELALACDIRICSNDCLMASPEINWGLITGCNGSARLERILGKASALEFIIRGEMINSKRALEIGLVNQVVSRKELIDKAFDMVRSISEKERKQINFLIKQILY